MELNISESEDVCYEDPIICRLSGNKDSQEKHRV